MAKDSHEAPVETPTVVTQDPPAGFDQILRKKWKGYAAAGLIIPFVGIASVAIWITRDYLVFREAQKKTVH
jgi:hypothetical protein